MFMRSKLADLPTAFLLCAGIAFAQMPDAHGSLKIELPNDSPVTLVSSDWGQSRPTVRGGAVMLDLHSSLSLRNSGSRRIRGITLVVLAQEVTPGGKGSVMLPSLNVGPGETFPVRIDLQLLRPVQGAEALSVQIGLDGVLFDDLQFYGPDKLKSRRSLTVWELEAQRDRRYFKTLLERAGVDGLQKEILACLARQPQPGRASMGVQMVRGRATNYEPERDVQFAFLKFPDSPIEPIDGHARIAGNEAREPQVRIRNRSSKSVRYAEIAWIVEDQQGREFLAGSVPADLNLAPGQKTEVLHGGALRFPERTGVKTMTAFISNVEYTDGNFWIPSRAEISGERLQHVVAPSPEEQRLVQIYNKRGIKGLIEELKKF
jgi:hypothetical protein